MYSHMRPRVDLQLFQSQYDLFSRLTFIAANGREKQDSSNVKTILRKPFYGLTASPPLTWTETREQPVV
jgi:hypothetical protein